MKQILSSIIMCLVAIAVSAQQKADIEVSYTAHQPSLRDGKEDLTAQYILLAGGDDSKFYSPKTEYLDSLNSTPEGKARVAEVTRNAALSGNWDGIPRADGSYYVVKNGQDNTLSYYDKSGTEKFCYVDVIPQLNWEVGDSTRIILGYECFEATADLYGRKWTAWFTPDIPVVAGPWKLSGLPGLILEAVCDGGQYSFEATGIQQTNKPITSVYLADSYEKTERIKFLKTKRSFTDNPLGTINAQFGGEGIRIGSVKNADGTDTGGKLFVTRDIVDFIETDY